MRLRKWAVLGAAALALYGGGKAAGVQVPVPASLAADGSLTGGQRQFAARLAADTGLDVHVVAAWELAEESGSAAQARQAAGNDDWLNIGYTDSGTYGAADGIWSSPVSAADATAAWLRGADSVPGYGRASAAIRAIVATAGRSPQAQVSAIRASGWASGGYPGLYALYAQQAAAGRAA